MIQGHGDDFYGTGREVRANFSTNVWYGADRESLRRMLMKYADRMLHYPEADAASFREAAARYHGLKAEQVLVGNGATELFYLIAHAWEGSDTCIPVPSFREYEDACRLYKHRLYFLTPGDEEEIPPSARLMFLCNPNNPDGRIVTESSLRSLLSRYPEMMIVADESFLHFAPEAQTACGLLAEYPNLIVVRSMTKSFAIPGLRLGYMLGHPDVIASVASFRYPWSVNALAIEMGKDLLQHSEIWLPDAGKMMERQKRFQEALASVAGFYPQPSFTSFFLVKTDYDAMDLKRCLLEKYGILIREASNFRGLDRHYFRLNTLTEENNLLLVKALEEYVGNR